MPTHTPLPWGVSVLNRDLGSDAPRADGAMILSPSQEERQRKREAGEYPITTVRVAMLEATHYTPHAVAVANAALIVRSVNSHAALVAACAAAAAWKHQMNEETHELIQAALALARKEM